MAVNHTVRQARYAVPMQAFRLISGIFAVLLWGLCTFAAAPAYAASVDIAAQTAEPPLVDGRYGSIVVDADSLNIIHARQIDAQRFPASLTKLMTLYLTFDALNDGTLTLDQKLPISRKAQNTPPGKLGVKKGQFITVDDAIQAVTVKSANDVAVVLAEAIGGTEAQFAEMMTARAISLGMVKTQFSNPHGLPNPLQVTTARDMAKLAMAHLNNHSRYYHYFGQKSFRYKGKTYKNTNGLLHWLEGVDGFKTGYTRASGYNLVVSAKRDGRRIIAVVLGGASNKSRNAHMQDLIERSFTSIGVQPMTSVAPVMVSATKRKTVKKPVPSASPMKTASAAMPSAKLASAKIPAAVRLRGRNNQPVTITTKGAPIAAQSAALDNAWSIQVGTFNTKQDALAQLEGVGLMVSNTATPVVMPFKQNGRVFYRARFKNISSGQAQKSCRALSALKTGCAVISPGGR